MYNSAYFKERYEYIRKLGQGGSGCVALVKDRNIKKNWAAKLVSKTGLFCADSEIEMLKSIDYYMFPGIRDAFPDDENICIITDYIEGENLKSYIEREGPFSVNIALRFYEELIKALIYLHSRSPSILYLDMKPENIMLTKSGEIRLIDFGIARSILTKNRCFGTSGYSPPEQYKSSEQLDEKADVFALSMTMYTLLTAKRPHNDLNIQKRAIKKENRIPVELRKILLKSVDENPEKRPSPSEILKMLKDMKKGRKMSCTLAVLTAFILLILFILTPSVKNYIERTENNKIAREMIALSDEHIENGQYTREGIDIICGYLNGGYLDKDTEIQFTYKVAMYFFNIQKDYVNAYTYFKRIEESGYSDVSEYLLVCEKMRGFSDSSEIVDAFREEINDENAK